MNSPDNPRSGLDDPPTTETATGPWVGVSPRPSSTRPGRGNRLSTPPAGPTPTPFFPVLPRYQIYEPIGHGGMGQVVRARDLTLGREVAIKFLLRPHDAPPAALERFAREAKILAQLDHPHVVPVYDSGEACGYLYYVMKLVPGGSLVRQSAAVRGSARRVADLIRKVALAVQHVHDKGMLHRDLKPGNVLVDDRGEPLVVDFGVAKWDDGHTATTGFAMFGTPAYAAPEVAVGGSAAGDGRADVWSLGVMLFELLAGRRPFEGERDDPELFTRVQKHAPPPRAGWTAPPADADEALEAIALTCLAKAPAGRYPTAAALADDLGKWLAGEPVGVALDDARRAAVGKEAAPPPAPKRVRRWPRVAVAVGLLVAVVGLLMAPVVWPKPPKKKTLAERLANPGDVVTFVDAGGKLLERVDGDLPGFENEGTVKAGPDGYCELSSTRKYFLELGNEPLELPLVLTAEVRFSRMTNAEAVCGVYAARRLHPQVGGGRVHTAFVTGHWAVGPGGAAAWPDTVPAFASATRVEPKGPVARTVFLLTPFGPDEVTKDPPPPVSNPYQPGEFHTFSVRFDATTFHTRRDGRWFPARRWDRLTGGLRSALRTAGETLTEPPAGDGFGLFVQHGDCQFRKVTLERPTP